MSRKIVLAIESSCDDSSVCLIEKTNHFPKLHSFESFSQEKILAKWGGIVPEIAAREHSKTIPPLLKYCLQESKISPHEISALAVTTNPGLSGSLQTGLQAAKTLALIYKLPLIPVNHLKAHLEAIHLDQQVSYPYWGLLISGGHTLIYRVLGPNTFELKGQTLDDAAGEAFDKGGKLLGLGYPAGRVIDELASSGDKLKYKFPISYLKDRPGKMSFSGLKTALRNFSLKHKNIIQAEINHICASYQEAIAQTLKIKLKEVIKESKDPIVVGGGVACNSYLRTLFQENFPQVFFVSPKYCADNAAMVGNWALLNPQLEIPFPECLALSTQAKIIEKNYGNVSKSK